MSLIRSLLLNFTIRYVFLEVCSVLTFRPWSWYTSLSTNTFNNPFLPLLIFLSLYSRLCTFFDHLNFKSMLFLLRFHLALHITFYKIKRQSIFRELFYFFIFFFDTLLHFRHFLINLLSLSIFQCWILRQPINLLLQYRILLL